MAVLHHKRPALAAALGLLLGPIGTIYFGLVVTGATLVVTLSAAVFVRYQLPASIHSPPWLGYGVCVFFAYWNYFLANVVNEALVTTDSKVRTTGELAAFTLIPLASVYIHFLALVCGGYSSWILITQDGRWFAGLCVFFILVPLAIWVFERVAAILLMPIGAMFCRLNPPASPSSI